MHRRLLIIGAGGIAAALAMTLRPDTHVDATPPDVNSEVTAQPQPQERIVVAIPSRDPIDIETPDPFAPAPRKVQAALPTPVPSLPPAPTPTAPPLPYRYIGRVLNQEGTMTVFIARDRRVLTAKTDDTIDGQYHVDDITADTIVFTYLPLATRQTLVAK